MAGESVIMSDPINLTISEKGIATLCFDAPDSGANVFNSATLACLEERLTEIEANSSIKGLVINSAKDSIFIAGADISEFCEIDSPEAAREVIRKGQGLFMRIQQLRVPTVAAIHGAAMGGGCEITLACDYRLATPDKCTKIGLPETNLGILPGWGGSIRLPRIVGLPRALDIILAGKKLVAKQALKAGLIDLVVPREHLPRLAEEYIAKGKPAPRKFKKTNNALVAKIARSKSIKVLDEKTNGHYPAPYLALDVVLEGLKGSVESGMRLEEDAFVELIETEVSRNLVQVFFLQERAKKFKVKFPKADAARAEAPVKNVAVIGAGVMGAGIAQWCAAKGQQVILKDINPDALNKGMANIYKTFSAAAKRRIFTREEARSGYERVTPIFKDIPMTNVDIIIEAATEKMDLKKKIFAGLEKGSGADTIVATNTSALSINEIANALEAPEKMVGVHFFNPVNKMPLVEVIVGERSDPAVVARALKYVQKIGKMPVVVKDSPGFLVNRILMPYLIEAGNLYENGAKAADLDEAMLSFGMPMGPCRLIDEIGVDVSLHVAEFFASVFGERMALPKVLSGMVEKGWLGRKSGKGFYEYGNKKSAPKLNGQMLTLQENDNHNADSMHTLQNRMVYLMVNEAAMCLEEGVVQAPEDVDFGMIMGTGFAPFRGGPCRYADAEGADKIVPVLKLLVDKGEAHFTPCELLSQMAHDKNKFYKERNS